MPAEPVIQQSQLMWYLQTLGTGGLMVALAALVAFGLTLVIIQRGRGPTAGAALVFIVPLPMLVAVFSELKGMNASFSVIATSHVELKASEVNGAIASTLALLVFGMLSMAPSYGLALLFLFRRAVQPDVGGEAANEPE